MAGATGTTISPGVAEHGSGDTGMVLQLTAVNDHHVIPPRVGALSAVQVLPGQGHDPEREASRQIGPVQRGPVRVGAGQQDWLPGLMESPGEPYPEVALPVPGVVS